MGRKSIVAILLPILAGLLWVLLKETYLAILIEEVMDRAARWSGMPRPDMIAVALPYLLALGVVSAVALIFYNLGAADRKSFEPTPDLDPRLAFKRVLENKRWQKKYTERDPERRQYLVSDYLEIRLHDQMHAALAQDRLFAWGQKSQPVTDGPFDRIPASKWHEIEIIFVPYDADRRAYAIWRTPNKMIASNIAYVGLKLNAAQVAKEFSLNRRVPR